MDKYVADTSALITAMKFYPPNNFKPFWDFLIDINKSGKLIIIDKVKEEIEKGHDYLKADFAPNILTSKSDIPDVINLFPYIMSNLTGSHIIGFKQWLKCCDPFVIAYGEYLKQQGSKVLILHGEKVSGSKIKIPFVCNKINLPQDHVNRLIEEEKLSFDFT